MRITIMASNVYHPQSGETTSIGEIRIKALEEYTIASIGEERARELIRAILKEVRERGEVTAHRDERNEWLIRWKICDITVEYVGEDRWSKFEAISLRF